MPVLNIQRITRIASFPINLILLIFTIRRIIFTVAMLNEANKKERTSADQEYLPSVITLISCRDEVAMIPDLCRAIEQINYPPDKYQVVLIDDGSTDGTGELMDQQAQDKPGWNVLKLSRNAGKASALNSALDRFPFGEIVYIFDADHRPDPEVIKRAVCYFKDPKVAGVTGYTKVLNPTASPSAYYSTIESYTNQLVTMRAKDRLNLAPALLGSNCGYRREFLSELGGFRAGAFSEDSDLTVAFYKAGFLVRFAEDAVSYQQVPQTVAGYLKQHRRWGRGLYDVARVHYQDILRNQKLSLPLRLELFLFSAGYLDRIALLGASILSALSYLSKGLVHFSPQVFFIALLSPMAQIIALFIKERMPKSMWVRLPIIPVFFTLDILAAVRASLDTVFDRSRLWTKTERVIINRDENNIRLYR